MRGSIYVTVRRSFVLLSVRLSVPSIDSSNGNQRTGDIDTVGAVRRRSAANADSVTLRADGGGSTQTYSRN